jgi:hypothetical protein
VRQRIPAIRAARLSGKRRNEENIYLLKYSCILAPDISAKIQSLDGNVHVRAFAEMYGLTRLNDCAITKNYGRRYRDVVIASGNSHCTVNGRAQAQCFADYCVEERKPINGFCVCRCGIA